MSTGTLARVSCNSCPIRHRAVCARADETELARLEQIKTYRTYAAGETIAWRGDQLRFVASVVTGVATLSKTLEDGRTQMVGLLLPGDFIGKPGRSEIDFDVTATTKTTLCCFERKAFEQLIDTTPHIAQRLMEIALDELEAAREWMLLLGRKTARETIATFLCMLVRRHNVDAVGLPRPAMALPLNREAIANYLGLTLETISRQLTALRKEGVVQFSDRRHFEVADMDALRAATGDDADLTL